MTGPERGRQRQGESNRQMDNPFLDPEARHDLYFDYAD